MEGLPQDYDSEPALLEAIQKARQERDGLIERMAALEQEAEELQQDEHQLQNEVQQLNSQVSKMARSAGYGGLFGMEER